MVFGLAIVGFWLVWPSVWRYWGSVVTGWGTTSSSVEWFDPAFALLWVMMLVIVAIAVVIAGVSSRSARPGLLALAIGIACGAIASAESRHFFSVDATAASYVWTYGTYFMAPLGALAGFGVSKLMKPATREG